MKILYLEDDAREARSFVSKLSEVGFEPVWEKTMEGALSHLPNAQSFQFGLFDIKLRREEGDVSGIDAAQKFVQKGLPVFLLSHHTGDASIVKAARDAGLPANFIFPKKITEGNLGAFSDYLLTALESSDYAQFLPEDSSKLEPPGGKIAISEGQGGARWLIAPKDILFLEADDHYCKIHVRQTRTNGGEGLRIHFGRPLIEALRQLERLSPFTVFQRFGRSVAINLSQIERIENGKICFSDTALQCPYGTVVEAFYVDNGWALTTARPK